MAKKCSECQQAIGEDRAHHAKTCGPQCAARRQERVVAEMNQRRKDERAKGRKRCPHCGSLLVNDVTNDIERGTGD